MTEPTTPDRVIDHNNECVGCGSHSSAPCHPSCPFEAGQFGPAVLLRAAAGNLREHPAGVGYSISAALFATALELVGGPAAAAAADEASGVLAGFLVARSGGAAETIHDQVVYCHGLFSDLPEIAQSMYAAAARHDGIDFDPDHFGE